MKKTKELLLYILIAILFINCTPDVVKLKPKASFDYSPMIDIKTTDTIKISNCSENSNSYYWNFGDGHISYEKSPKYIYRLAGSYNVKLIATNGIQSDSIIKTIDINDIITLNVNVPNASYYPHYNLDVNADGIIDFQFYYSNTFSNTRNDEYTTITPLNNYNVNSETIRLNAWYTYWNSKDTTFNFNYYNIPKVNHLGDILTYKNSDPNKPIYITLRNNPHSGGINYSTDSITNWIGDDLKYIGFCKLINNKSMIGWIKIKAKSLSNVTIISYKIPIEAESLLIDK